MIPDRPDHRVRPAAVTPEFVAMNIRGVMLAAFLPTETIAAALGIDVDDADRFRWGALDDIRMTQAAIAQAKHRMRPTR